MTTLLGFVSILWVFVGLVSILLGFMVFFHCVSFIGLVSFVGASFSFYGFLWVLFIMAN